MNKKIFYLIALSVLILMPGVIFAQGDLITPILCTFAKNLWQAAMAGIAIAWAVVVVLFVISTGNPEKVNIAKKGLMVALIGTVILILGTASLTMVGKAIGLARGGGDICGGIGGTKDSGSCNPPCTGSDSCREGRCVSSEQSPPQQNNPGTPSSDTNTSQPMDWNKLWKPSDDD